MLNVLFGVAIGLTLSIAFQRLLIETLKVTREYKKELMARLTGRRFSLVWDPERNKWKVFEKMYVMGAYSQQLSESREWRRAVQLALDGAGPAPGCESCRNVPDAVTGLPYAICQNCGRTLLEDLAKGAVVVPVAPHD